ncbi:MAG: lysylphosphatidylglycerol synthase transmembrane domain-containing protein [Desulfomonilaceae bacterium]
MTASNKSKNSNSRVWELAAVPESIWVHVFGYAVVVAFLVGCAYYVHSRWNDFGFLHSVSLPELALAGLLVLGSLSILAWQLALFLESFGVNLGVAELMALTMSSNLGNLVVPARGGTAAVAVYLDRVRGMDLKAFAVIYSGSGLLMTFVNSVVALGSLAFLFLFKGFFHTQLTLWVVAMVALSGYLIAFPPSVNWKRGGIIGHICDIMNSWHLATRNRRLVLKLTAASTAAAFLVAASFFFIYKAVGGPLPVLAVLVTSSVGNIATVVPVVPGSLGVYDLITIHILQVFDMDPAKSVAATLLYRGFLFLWLIPLGATGLVYLNAMIRGKHCMTSTEGGMLSREIRGDFWPQKVLGLFGLLDSSSVNDPALVLPTSLFKSELHGNCQNLLPIRGAGSYHSRESRNPATIRGIPSSRKRRAQRT